MTDPQFTVLIEHFVELQQILSVSSGLLLSLVFCFAFDRLMP